MYYRDDKFIKKFGNRLRELRKAKGISQEALAGETGFELSQIGRIERGEINTSISHVASIAKALKVKPEELFQF
ncbi:MAG: helix-turn-helix transcriptional regulator [Chitinophagaceae bacterium]|nr:helix-turn-helix transcriptional regulator [Chitinophagaceae bacterium]